MEEPEIIAQVKQSLASLIKQSVNYFPWKVPPFL